jgi:hypothetical protein
LGKRIIDTHSFLGEEYGETVFYPNEKGYNHKNRGKEE